MKLQNKLIRMLFLFSILPLLIIAIITILGVLSIRLFIVAVVFIILMAMTLQLKTAKQQLEEYAKDMENKVKQRAAQLESVHKELLECEKMAAMGRMASALSHELKNVFMGIQTSAYYLKGKILKEYPHLADSFSDIEKETNYANSIINNILSFTRPKKITPSEVDINLIVEDVFSSLSKQAMFRNIKIDKELSSELPRIKADGVQIREVILNLVINAIQAMPDGGRLTLVTKQQENFLRIEVIDTGSGVSKEVMEKLFTPFLTTKTRGLGLGLSICEEIIGGHGGSIDVETQLNKGTKFVVSLPLRGL